MKNLCCFSFVSRALAIVSHKLHFHFFNFSFNVGAAANNFSNSSALKLMPFFPGMSLLSFKYISRILTEAKGVCVVKIKRERLLVQMKDQFLELHEEFETKTKTN